MKTWIKAIGIACLAEFPLLMGLATMNSEEFVSRVLAWYHMFATSFAFTVLNIIWAWPSPEREPARTSSTLTFFLIYVFQVMLTTPIIYSLLRWIHHIRRVGKA